jgi:hypothetical protein
MREERDMHPARMGTRRRATRSVAARDRLRVPRRTPLASRVRSLSVRHTSCTSRWNPGSVRQMPRQRGSSARPIWCGYEDRKHIAEEAVSYSDELGSSGVSPFATASIQSAASSDM